MVFRFSSVDMLLRFRSLWKCLFTLVSVEVPLHALLCRSASSRSALSKCLFTLGSVEVPLHAHFRIGSKKKLNLSRPSRRSLHPSPQKKQHQHATLQQQSQTNNKHYLNIFIYYLFIFILLFDLLVKRCELLLLFLRGGVKAASGGPRKI